MHMNGEFGMRYLCKIRSNFLLQLLLHKIYLTLQYSRVNKKKTSNMFYTKGKTILCTFNHENIVHVI